MHQIVRVFRVLAQGLGLFVVAASAGCVLYGDAEPYRTCAEVVCGNNASCGDGQCFCDPGTEGNPYTGCLAVQPEVDPDCSLDCGANAFCSGGACYCEADHVAVCGANAGCMAESRLCDGLADCPNSADENVAVCQPPLFQEWLLTDGCDDTLAIEWRLLAQDRDWAWPGADEVFRTPGFNVDTYQTIQCFADEVICFAGASGSLTWGLGLDNSGDCEDCCFYCGAAPLLDIGYLTCE